MNYNNRTYVTGKDGETNLEVILGMLAAISSTRRTFDERATRMPGAIIGNFCGVDVKETREDLKAIRQQEHTPHTQKLHDHYTYELDMYRSVFFKWNQHAYPGHQELLTKGFDALETLHHELTPQGISFSFWFNDGAVINVFFTNDFLVFPARVRRPDYKEVLVHRVDEKEEVKTA